MASRSRRSSSLTRSYVAHEVYRSAVRIAVLATLIAACSTAHEPTASPTAAPQPVGVAPAAPAPPPKPVCTRVLAPEILRQESPNVLGIEWLDAGTVAVLTDEGTGYLRG